MNSSACARILLDDLVDGDELLYEQVVLLFLDFFSISGRSWPGTTTKTVA